MSAQTHTRSKGARQKIYHRHLGARGKRFTTGIWARAAKIYHRHLGARDKRFITGIWARGKRFTTGIWARATRAFLKKAHLL